MFSDHHRSVEEILKLFDPARFQHPVAVTLTMKKRVGCRNIGPIIASENFRHFINRLTHKLLGSRAKRYGAKLQAVAVIEPNADGRLHYHAMIDRPYHCTFDEFKAAITEQWLRTDFGYRQIDIQDAATPGWTNCMLKSRQKNYRLLDSIDWNKLPS
jgi:hypothetical protein